MRAPPRPFWQRELFRIRTRLLIASAFLVLTPLAGLSFARTYERELLRSEEDAMVAVAVSLASGIGYELNHGGTLTSPGILTSATAAARSLGAQIRILGRDGRAVFDTGAERLEARTRGRSLLSVGDLAYRRRQLVITDPPPEDGVFSTTRAEVRRALGGNQGRIARKPSVGRGVRLYVAEPVGTGSKDWRSAKTPTSHEASSQDSDPSAGVGLPTRPRATSPGTQSHVANVQAVVYVSRTTYPVLVGLYRVRNGLLRIALGSLAVALALGSFLALTISRPLGKLMSAAQRIAAGQRGVELKLSGRDETGDLARAFDAMARELDARLGYISELAANVSHEFKTPIASIRGAAELLRDGAADDAAARERFLANILDDTDRLARLVTRLLELSRVEARPEAPVLLDYRALAQRLTARYQAAGHNVALEYDARDAELAGRSQHLESALSNLVDNAVRFSAAGARVIIRVSDGRDGGLTTQVIDEGRGISAANLERIWERFFTTAREQGGTGLGLAIVRAIVEAHGGEIGVRSNGDQGSVFWFTLPHSADGDRHARRG